MSLHRLVPMQPVKNMPASVLFYEKLGFVTESRNDEWGWAMLRCGDCQLMLDQSIHLHAGIPRASVLYLYPSDVADFHRRARESGLSVPELDLTFYGMTEFRLEDPDGNRLWIGQSKAESGDASPPTRTKGIAGEARLEAIGRGRVQVTALGASDAPRYRELMLEAYVLAADAFTSTASERQAEPPSWWIDRIASPSGLSQAFGAFLDQQLVGTVAVEYSARPKTCHSALIIGMYVRPAARGLGVGRALLDAVVAAARARLDLRQLRLTVTEDNDAAIHLYESAGFSTWGTEPSAIRTPSGYKGKVHMLMPLTGPVSHDEPFTRHPTK